METVSHSSVAGPRCTRRSGRVRPPRTLTSGRRGRHTHVEMTWLKCFAWRTRMETHASKTIYPQHGATAERVNAHAPPHRELKFGVRGIDEVVSVMRLVAIIHNLLLA